MEIIAKGFWDYVRRWREIFSEERKIRWENNWLENYYCRDCRFCCGPQDSALPFPMALSPEQAKDDAASKFHLLDCRTACLLPSGCKSDGPQGCKLALAEKPLACGLFPIVLANGGLYLYQNCPAAVFTPLVRFMDIGQEAARMLAQLTPEELRHISLWLTWERLAANFIDLHIRIFDPDARDVRIVFS